MSERTVFDLARPEVVHSLLEHNDGVVQGVHGKIELEIETVGDLFQ